MRKSQYIDHLLVDFVILDQRVDLLDDLNFGLLIFLEQLLIC